MADQDFMPEKLYTISGNGYSAACDAYAVDNDEEEIWFASVLGPLASIKAISAAFTHPVEGRKLHLNSDDFQEGFRGFQPGDAGGQWIERSMRLPRVNAYHGIFYPKMAEYRSERSRFIIIARSPEETPALHRRFLSQRTPLPIHESWSKWIWERSLRTGETRKLESIGIQAYICSPNEKTLAQDLSRGVREGELRVE